MQIRIMGTKKENEEMIEILQNALQEKIKIISPAYRNRNNDLERVYVEIDLQNINYRKKEFSEKDFLEDLNKRFSP